MPLTVEFTADATLGPYRIERVLGRGGMSVVYLAEHVPLGRRVALKLLSPQLAESERFRTRFLRESRLAATIDHPNVVSVYDAGETEGQLYIAMRYVDGSDLRALLRSEGPLDAGRTAAIVEQAAAGLEAAHARGLVHRDVKPSNILIERASEDASRTRVYVADFGLTKHATSESALSSMGEFVGTIAYVAPEQIRGDPIDDRTDVYSLGAVLYECLTGVPPFGRESDLAVLWAHVQDPRPRVTDRRRDLPSELDHVVAKALAKSPGDRYASPLELAHAAQRAVGLPAPRPILIRARRTLARDRKRRLSVSAVAVAAVVAASLLIVSRLGPETTPEGTAKRIDASTGAVTREVALGSPLTGRQDPLAPGALPPLRGAAAASNGSIWVTNGDDETLTRIDPDTGRTSTVALPSAPDTVAVGSAAVWATATHRNAVYRVDPRSNRLVRSVLVRGDPDAIAVDERTGDAWVASSTCHPCGITITPPTLQRIDAKTNEVVESVVVPGCCPVAVALVADAVWVGMGDGRVYRVRGQRPAIEEELRLGTRLAGLVYDRSTGTVWASVGRRGESRGIVVGLDATDYRPVNRVMVGCCPGRIAVGAGSLWVTDSRAQALIRLSRTADARDTIRVGGSPTTVTVADSSVWVAVDAPR